MLRHGFAPLAWKPWFDSVFFQSFSHACNVVFRETQFPVETHHTRIRFPNLNVDLGASKSAESHHRLSHHLASEFASLVVGGDSKVAQPTSMPFVPAHDRRDDLTAVDTDQEEFRLYSEFPLDVRNRWAVFIPSITSSTADSRP